METIEIFGRKLITVEDKSGICNKCALLDICHFSPMPCRDSNGNTNRRFEKVK